jgi:hypothetical protein
MIDKTLPIPPILADMIRKLGDKTLPESERDNICAVLREVEQQSRRATTDYLEARGRANEEDRRSKRGYSRVGHNQR